MKGEWKKQRVEPNRILWTKGKFKPGNGYKDWVHLDKLDNSYEVGARKKINPKTINGHFKYFKNKSSATKLVNKYLKDVKEKKGRKR